MRQRPPGHHEELEHVVERRRVAAAFANHRQDLLQVVAEEARLEQPFARAHPVDVARERVDLAVVRDVAVRVRERPRRERVRAEPLVHERQRRLHVGVRQIREHRLDLARREHALVDQRVRRQADDVEELPAGVRQRQLIHRALEPLADHVQPALERRVVGRGFPGFPGFPGVLAALRDEDLFEHRLDGHRARADRAVVGRHVAPADQALAFFGRDRGQQPLDRFAVGRIARQEHEADAVLAGGRERRRSNLSQKLVRDLEEDAGAVAGVGLAAARAAVRQVLEHLQRLADDGVRLAAFDVHDEADAAGVVLVAGVVEARALSRRTGRSRGGKVGDRQKGNEESQRKKREKNK